MHESLADLLEQQGSICNIEADRVLDLLKAIIQGSHFGTLLVLELLSLFLQGFGVVLKSRRQCYTLLKSSLDNQALEVFLFFELRFS
jgi:hypothetical protein